jgi:dCTP deaminase
MPKTEVAYLILSDVEIEERINNHSLQITPFEPSCLNGAGYDLRLAEELTMEPHQHRLVATLERVELGDNLVGTLHIRSSLARWGIIASLALVDPGFRGQLTILLYNVGSRKLELHWKERFIQIAIHQLSTKTQRSYHGKYQDSQGIVDSRLTPP